MGGLCVGEWVVCDAEHCGEGTRQGEHGLGHEREEGRGMATTGMKVGVFIRECLEQSSIPFCISWWKRKEKKNGGKEERRRKEGKKERKVVPRLVPRVTWYAC